MRLVRAAAVANVAIAAHCALNATLMRRPDVTATEPGLTVAVLIPARNEVANIADCLRSVLAQDCVGLREIVVLDDGSSDGTAAAAEAVGRDDPRVRVLSGAPVPSGWLGKTNACAQLASAAGDVDVLVFLDADVRLAGSAIRATLAQLDLHGLDHVSPYPRQEGSGVLQRLVQPLLWWSLLAFLPVRIAERSRRPSLAVANGQFLMVRRAAYERAGGHGAIRSEVLDDIALARRLAATGSTGGVTDGSQIAHCRMYRTDAALIAGYSKSLWASVGSPLRSASLGAGLLALFVLPAAAALRGSRAGTVAVLAAIAGRLIAARRSGSDLLPDAAGHVGSIAAYAFLLGRSLRGRRRGTLSWKGRVLP